MITYEVHACIRKSEVDDEGNYNVLEESAGNSAVLFTANTLEEAQKYVDDNTE